MTGTLVRNMRPTRFSTASTWIRRSVGEHPLLTVFAVAFGVRVIASAAVFLLFDGSLLLDDATYSDMAAQAASGGDESWDPYVHWLYLRTAFLLWPLTWLYEITGPIILVGQLFVAVFGALTAVVVTRLASEVLDPRGSLLAGMLVALLPSQVIFSSLVMKDAQAWLVLSSIALLVAFAGRADRSRMLLAVAASAALLFLLGHVRLHTATAASLALLLTSWTGQGRDRRLRAAAFSAVAIAVPVILGIGPLGLNIAAGYATQLESIRMAQATGGSALSAAKPTTTKEPALGEGDAASPPGVSGDSSLATNVRYLPIGVFSMLFEPGPWRRDGSVALRLAQVENLVWYPLLAFAMVGTTRLWRYRRALLYPLVVGGGTLVMWALVEGNAGTAYRHRGEFVWVVCVLAVVGLSRMPWPWAPNISPSIPEEQPPG